MRRELKAGPQLVEALDDLEAPLGGLAQRALGRQGEIGVAAHLGAPDPAAQLIELRQTEAVGAVHDQRVGGRNVEPGLDDVGGDQQVELAVVERRHDLLQLLRRHPAVGDGDLHLGHQMVELLRELRLVLDPGADIEGLAAAVVLPQDRLAQHHGVGRQHEGAHRQAIDRRGGDDAELLQPAERHLECARDRRRGHGQHVDLGAQLLQALLVGDAEMLLLVDHHQT